MNRFTPGCRCCAPSNPCGCTWPRVLSFAGHVSQAQASFYFTNLANAYPEPVYTLSYGPRPVAIPKQLQLLYFNFPGGVHDPYFVDMPDNAWFSGGIPGTVFGGAVTVYFWLWMQSCQANVMVIDTPYGVGTGPDAAKGAGNNVISYIQTACQPEFQMRDNLAAPKKLYGAHGADDLIPDATQTAGQGTNFRIGRDYTLSLVLPSPTPYARGGHGTVTISYGPGAWTPTNGPPAWSTSDPTVAAVTPIGNAGQARIDYAGAGPATISVVTNYAPYPTLSAPITVT